MAPRAKPAGIKSNTCQCSLFLDCPIVVVTKQQVLHGIIGNEKIDEVHRHQSPQTLTRAILQTVNWLLIDLVPNAGLLEKHR